MTPAVNTWIYAIVPADRPLPPGLAGVADEAPHAIAGPDLEAVAGTVPRADFDDAPLQDHLEDPAWLERAVRAHHEVIGALARGGPVLPMRFATLYRDDDRVAAMLRAQHGELLGALGRIAGRTEWGVKVYVAEPSAPDSEPDPATDEQRPGTAYLMRRKARHEDHREALRHAMDQAQQVHAALAATAAASTQHPLQTTEASGRREPMVLNGAYLVDDAGLPALEAAVDALAADHPGLRLEVTGPWPPYSFSGVDPNHEAE